MSLGTRRDKYQRRPPSRDPYDTVLIVCEGEKTEPAYFKALVYDLKLSSANIEITQAGGTDPLTIVNYGEARLGEYDKVFCVFDRDTHANFGPAVRKVNQSGQGKAGRWAAITSTPCFELWLLLHFRFYSAPIAQTGKKSPGDVACDILDEEMRSQLRSGYQKGSRDIYSMLKALRDQAIVNAQKLTQINQKTHSDNPETNVHLLVDYLIKLKPPQWLF